MSCCRRTLSEYVDGELGPAQGEALEQHLATCHHCQDVLAAYREISLNIRALPRRAAPATLGRDVFAALEQEHAGLPSLLATLSRLPTGAAVAILLVILAFAALNLYQRQYADEAGGYITAVPVSSAKGVPPREPIAIRFGQAMDRTSVERSTRIDPPAEVTYNWAEDSLIVRPRAAFNAHTTYTVTIIEPKNARGEPLDKPIAVQFRTTDQSTNPSQANEPDEQLVLIVAILPTPARAAVAQANRPAPSPSSSPSPAVVAAARPKEPTPGAAQQRATAEPGTSVSTGSISTGSVSTGPQPTAIEKTATPARGSFQTALAPTATSSVTAAVTSTLGTTIALACRVTPGKAVGSIYDAATDVRARLGCASEPEHALALAEQPFQNGQMLWRGDTKLVYVFHVNQTWVVFKDTWQDNEPLAGKAAPPSGLYEPVRGIGKVWRDNPAVKAGLGWATGFERAFTGSAQTFERGLALATDQKVTFVLYGDGSLQKHPIY